jgi:surface antigen
MRRFAFICILVCVCFLSLNFKNASANFDLGTPQAPFTYNGNTYDNFFCYNPYVGSGRHCDFYNQKYLLINNRIFVQYYNTYWSQSYFWVLDYDFSNKAYSTAIECSSGYTDCHETNTGGNASFYTWDDNQYNPPYSSGSGYNVSDVFTSADIYIYNNGYTHGGTGNGPQAFTNDIFFLANASGGTPPGGFNLSVTIDHPAGGTVTSNPASDFSCSNNPCQGSFSRGDVSLSQTASSGWVFAYWSYLNTHYTYSPFVITMDAAKEVIAKFFKTFRNAAGSFYNTSGTYGDGECVTYVNHETGITKVSGVPFSGNANTYYQEAIDEGYQVSDAPQPGSIIVFDIDTSKNMPYGHVGVVTGINGNKVTIQDQNWNRDGLIQSHEIQDITQYNIKGYIYYTYMP